MEDVAFIVSNDGKLNKVEDCPKVPLEHHLLLTLNDSDDYGHDIGTPFLPIDDFSPQEEPPDETKHFITSSTYPAFKQGEVEVHESFPSALFSKERSSQCS